MFSVNSIMHEHVTVFESIHKLCCSTCMHICMYAVIALNGPLTSSLSRHALSMSQSPTPGFDVMHPILLPSPSPSSPSIEARTKLSPLFFLIFLRFTSSSRDLTPLAFPICSNTHSLVLLSVHLTRNILRQSHSSKDSIILSSCMWSVQVSQPYRATLRTRAFASRIFRFRLSSQLFHTSAIEMATVI